METTTRHEGTKALLASIRAAVLGAWEHEAWKFWPRFARQSLAPGNTKRGNFGLDSRGPISTEQLEFDVNGIVI